MPWFKEKKEPAYGNRDLLGDLPLAQKDSVRFVFHVPDLFEQFRLDDNIANAAQRQTKRIGILAVIFVFVALVSASSHLLWRGDNELVTWFGIIAVVLGLFGSILGYAGWRHGARRKWLRYRLRTEMLRLFRFHFIAATVPEILAASGDPKLEAAYMAHRAQAFAVMKTQFFETPEAELARICALENEYDFDKVVPPQSVAGGSATSVADDLLAAWRESRLDWQNGYATSKLRNTTPVWNPYKSAKAYTNLGWICILAIVALHLAHLAAHLLAHFFGDKFMFPEGSIEFAVVAVAMAALAFRALEEGSQPHREVERYEGYRANIRVATERFEDAAGLAAKVDAMRGFERTSLEEMRVFLRTHANSKYLL